MNRQIVILNGASRSGKSTIAEAIQATFPGIWMNLGMDAHIACTPPRYRPGVGLRPGGTYPPVEGRVPPAELENSVPLMFAALYESIAAHARLGLNVVADVGHHETYTRPRGILTDCARRLADLPVLFVGVRCPLDVIWARREATWGQTPQSVTADVVAAVEAGQETVHAQRAYDLEVDTSSSSPAEIASAIRRRLEEGPPGSAFEQIAARP
ncbi:MAG TPA: chloramphenicol phosphotransferase [Actinomycetota bacterium]|nr:chloramphenicol phosphotransferase [Actinomycetota bacterium]